MKRLLLQTVVAVYCMPAMAQLHGTVIDKQTREYLPGVTVLLPELKQACITDNGGKFSFPKVTQGKFLIQTKMLGYSGQSKTADLSVRQTIDFELESSIIEKNEVVITGSSFTSDNRRTPLPVVPVDGLKITESTSDNLMQALTSVPGVSVISTGSGIAKPVIRGLSYNRVVVVNQGIRQEGQQWGSEHGPEIDQFSAEHVEILKGPSSLEYGSDALGGVIHILEPVPPPSGVLRGRINSQFASNNLLYGNSVLLEGNLSGFIWRVRGSLKSAAPYVTPTETVYNSGFSENSQGLLVGINRRWGYSHLHASRWSSDIGLTEGERDSLTGEFTDESGQIVSESDLKRREPLAPRQSVGHFRLSSTNNIIHGNSQFRINVGVQENHRREFEEQSGPAGIAMRLQTGTWDVRLLTAVKERTETAVGVSGMLQQNFNEGTEYLLPDYFSRDIGAFFTGKLNLETSTLNGGVRIDQRSLRTQGLTVGSDTLFTPLERTYAALSGSLGWTYGFSERTSLKANLGKGFRAPSVSELSANGLHEGTFRYEIGNAGLSPEHSWEIDLGMLHDREKLSFHADFFAGIIDNYIYYERSPEEVRVVDGTSYPVYRYVQADAFRRGGEVSLDFHLVEPLHFENSAAVVFAANTATGRPLPFTPPMRTLHELRYDAENKSGGVRRKFLKLTVENVLKQDRIDEFETPTDGYVLLHAGAGLEGTYKKLGYHIFLNLKNITNTVYFDHLSRYKDIGVSGAGRNLTLGIELDFGN